MQQSQAFLHVAQAEALLELADIGALPVVGEQQIDNAAPGADGDREMMGMAVPPSIGHAFLHDAVQDFFLIGTQPLRPLQDLKVNLHAGRSRKIINHMLDGLMQWQLLEIIGAQLPDAAPYVLESAQGGFLDLGQLFLGLVWCDVDEKARGIEASGNAGECVAERVMDLAGQPVAFARLGHGLCFDGIGTQPRIRFLELSVEARDALLFLMVLADEQCEVKDEQDEIQRDESIVQREDPGARSCGIVSGIGVNGAM